MRETEWIKIAELIRACPFLEYRFTFDIEGGLVGDYYAELAKKRFFSPETRFFSLSEDGRVTGVVSLQRLKWDSAFFKIPMGSVEDFCFRDGDEKSGSLLLERVLGFGREAGIRHLSAKVNTREICKIHLLEKAGFRHMDSILYYVIDLNRVENPRDVDGGAVTHLRQIEVDKACGVARRAFSRYRGRFEEDSSMPVHEASGFYLKWLKTSIENNFQNIFVSTHDNILSGFAVWNHDALLRRLAGKEVITLALIGVLPEMGGRGISCELIDFGMRFYREADYFLIPVHINNIAMQRSAVRSGARLVSSRYTFHLDLA